MTARVVDCGKPGSPCCDRKVDMYKIELDVNVQCKFAVTGVTVNGRQALMPTFDPYGSDNSKAVMKLTGLNLTLADADGAVVCMKLGGVCPTMEQLCPQGNGFCTYAIVQSGQCNCCPVGKLGFYPPPPQPPSPLPPSPPPPSPPPPSPPPPSPNPPSPRPPSPLPPSPLPPSSLPGVNVPTGGSRPPPSSLDSHPPAATSNPSPAPPPASGNSQSSGGPAPLSGSASRNGGGNAVAMLTSAVLGVLCLLLLTTA